VFLLEREMGDLKVLFYVALMVEKRRFVREKSGLWGTLRRFVEKFGVSVLE
jgi:hypothetical protein